MRHAPGEVFFDSGCNREAMTSDGLPVRGGDPTQRKALKGLWAWGTGPGNAVSLNCSLEEARAWVVGTLVVQRGEA